MAAPSIRATRAGRSRATRAADRTAIRPSPPHAVRARWSSAPSAPTTRRALGRRPLAHFGRMPPTSVLSDGTIRRLVAEGRVRIEPWDDAMVQPASVDLRLGSSFRVFHNHRIAAIDLADPPQNRAGAPLPALPPPPPPRPPPGPPRRRT